MAAKTVTVNLDYNEPKFDFEGEWTGKDIRIVQTHIRRAYLLRQRENRSAAKNTTLTELAQGGKK